MRPGPLAAPAPLAGLPLAHPGLAVAGVVVSVVEGMLQVVLLIEAEQWAAAAALAPAAAAAVAAAAAPAAALAAAAADPAAAAVMPAAAAAGLGMPRLIALFGHCDNKGALSQGRYTKSTCKSANALVASSHTHTLQPQRRKLLQNSSTQAKFRREVGIFQSGQGLALAKILSRLSREPGFGTGFFRTFFMGAWVLFSGPKSGGRKLW